MIRRVDQPEDRNNDDIRKDLKMSCIVNNSSKWIVVVDDDTYSSLPGEVVLVTRRILPLRKGVTESNLRAETKWK